MSATVRSRAFANKAPPSLNPIMAIGDSITQGAVDLVGGFRVAASAMMPALAWTGRLSSGTLHEGYGGFAIDAILAALGDVVFRLAPTTVVLMAGLNDVALQGQTSAATLTELRAAAETILAQSASIKHLLVADSPLPTSGTGWYATMAAVNAGLAAAFAGADAKIQIITICDTLVRPDDFGDSSAHPNTPGYGKIGARLVAEFARLGLTAP